MYMAIEIPLEDAELTINSGRDGVWLHFKASNGQSASINVDNMAVGRGGITGSALSCWCDDQRLRAAL